MQHTMLSHLTGACAATHAAKKARRATLSVAPHAMPNTAVVLKKTRCEVCHCSQRCSLQCCRQSGSHAAVDSSLSPDSDQTHSLLPHQLPFRIDGLLDLNCSVYLHRTNLGQVHATQSSSSTTEPPQHHLQCVHAQQRTDARAAGLAAAHSLHCSAERQPPLTLTASSPASSSWRVAL